MTVKNFGNMKNFWMFGVFDGHGVNGHFASDHIKQYLPSMLYICIHIFISTLISSFTFFNIYRQHGTLGLYERKENQRRPGRSSFLLQATAILR